MSNTDERTGKIQTVTGLVNPDDLGPTMMHEHLRFGPPADPSKLVYFHEPDDPTARKMAHAPVAPENMWWIRYNMRDNIDNLLASPLEVGYAELAMYVDAGGSTIVDVGHYSSAQDLEVLVDLSRRSGVKVVAGAGYYIDGSYPEGADVEGRQVDDLASGFVADILHGIGESKVRCGILGELGCSWPLRPSERKVLQAAAIAQQETGVMISIHPGRNEAALGEIRDVLAASGADPTRVVMGHIDRCGYELATRQDILDSGIVLEYDVFGMEGYYPTEAALADGHLPDMPNDVGRVKEIRQLIELGYRDQIVVGHDTHMKFQLARYGGYGFGHFLRNVVPLMPVYGIDESDIERMTTSTPRRLLTIA